MSDTQAERHQLEEKGWAHEAVALMSDEQVMTLYAATTGLGEIICRTSGSTLHLTKGEALTLLGELQEPDSAAVIRRRLEVALGEKTLGQVDDEAERERQRRKVEPLRDGAYRILCGLVQPSDVIDPADVIGSEMDWEQLRRVFPVADASTIDTEG